MSDENENENISEDTGKQAAVQSEVSTPESSPTSVEQTPPPQAAATRRTEFGDMVLYVEEERVLDATVQVAFTNGTANLRVLDPTSQLGYFDVADVKHDVGEAIGTFHFPG
jgi:hypothetical protein